MENKKFNHLADGAILTKHIGLNHIYAVWGNAMSKTCTIYIYNVISFYSTDLLQRHLQRPNTALDDYF